ncbi:MAG: HNH endonuclease [Armatimonadetes bacterium]|nr:HNH endonuclease [Armatimonadota bacterium]
MESFLRDHENEDEKKEHAVIERDGWRCTVPGCGSRWNLHVHHIEYRSQGGTDEPENETTVCMSCHQRAIHKGYIKVTGSAPGNLVWEIGVSPIHPQIAGYVNGLRVAA